MNLQQIIDSYAPSAETIRLVQDTRITLLVGISGAGKDTIKKKLLEKEDYCDIISHTTRSPRLNSGIPEQDGVDYHFVSTETATTMLAENKFIEAKLVHETIYGTSTQEVRVAHDTDKIAITDLDVQGVEEYKQISRDVVAIFILPPSYSVWRERLMQRYESSDEFDREWPRRRASAIKELEQALSVSYYHFIINDNLENSVRIANEIAHQGDHFYRKDDEARLVARDILEQIINPKA